MKLLSPYEIAEQTGLPYAKALMLIKAMAYIRIANRYYVSEANFNAFLTQESAIEIIDTDEEGGS